MPTNIIVTLRPTPISPIASVNLRILQNDTTALVFGFEYFDTSGQRVAFSGIDNAIFSGDIYQDHFVVELERSVVERIVWIDSVVIGTSQDTVTVPYSIQDFSGVDQSEPVFVSLHIRGLFTNTPGRINLERYEFELYGVSSVRFTGQLVQLPTVINGKRF